MANMDGPFQFVPDEDDDGEEINLEEPQLHRLISMLMNVKAKAVVADVMRMLTNECFMQDVTTNQPAVANFLRSLMAMFETIGLLGQEAFASGAFDMALAGEAYDPVAAQLNQHLVELREDPETLEIMALAGMDPATLD